MNPYIKSIVWLVGFGGAGYVLMELTKPNEAKLAAIRNSSERQSLNEKEKQKLLFMQKLQEATHSKPVYLKSTSELKKQNDTKI